jgi:hypothetical protein
MSARTGGIRLEIVRRSNNVKDFQVLRKRWIAERTYLRLAWPLPQTREGLREPHAQPRRVHFRHNTAHAAPNCKARGRHVKSPHEL